MALDQDSLQPIAPKQWPELRDMFLGGSFLDEVAYNSIQNYIDWKENNPHFQPMEILGLNESWRENGTFIIIDRGYMFFHTMDESNDSLLRALRLVDWNMSYRLCQVHISYRPVLAELIRLHEIETLSYDLIVLYKLPKENSLNLELDIPAELRLAKLESEHIVKADNMWDKKHEGSETLLRNLAAWNPSIGLFNASGELLAWCLAWSTGTINALQVATEHDGKGYASLVVKAIAKKLAKLGMNCYVNVHCEDRTLNSQYEELGFVPL